MCMDFNAATAGFYANRKFMNFDTDGTGWKINPLLLFLISAIIVFSGSRGYANDARADREHRKQLTILLKTMENTDKGIHQYLKRLNSMKGVEGLVFIYDCDKDIEALSTRVDQLANENYEKASFHAEAIENFEKRNGHSGFNKTEVTKHYQAMLSHLKDHITWFKSPDTAQKMAKTQEMAREILGPPDKDSIVSLYNATSNRFNSIAVYSRPANPHEMWNIAKAVGVKRFAAETGIDIFKNSPERQKAREKKRNAEMGITVEPIIFGAPPEGENYPHNFYYFKAEITEPGSQIVNRNLLALNSLESEGLHGKVEQLIRDYQSDMDKFKAMAGKRFDIQDWQKLPAPEKNWLSHARIWSIEQYQLIERRFNAILKMADPKADEDWIEMNKKLGFKSKVVPDFYETVKNMPKFE